MSDQELVDQLADVWASILDLGAELTEADWSRPSMLPGWSVQDVVAHMLATEELLLGRPMPEHVAPALPHVKNELGQLVENGVDFYRSCSGIQVLGSFAEVVDERIDELRMLDDEGFGAPAAFPLGDGTVRGLLPFRIVDCWLHEQDMRVALDRPGGWETNAVDLVFDRLFSGMGKVVAKTVGAPDGTVVAWRVGGVRYCVEVRGGRGRPVDSPDAPTVVLVMDPEVFILLAAGRGEPELLLPMVSVHGDEHLGVRILAAMNVMF